MNPKTIISTPRKIQIEESMQKQDDMYRAQKFWNIKLTDWDRRRPSELEALKKNKTRHTG